MKTTYLTTLTASFNPFLPHAAVPRHFLQMLSGSAQRNVKIAQKILPRASTQPSLLELGFKDGKKMAFTWKGEKDEVRLRDIVEQVERHARISGRKEELSG